MNKYFFIFFFLSGSSALLVAQSTERPYKTILYSDGSSFIGYTIEEDEDQILFDLYEMPDTLRLDKDLILNIFTSDDFITFPNGKTHPRKGIYSSAGIHYGGSALDNTIQIELIGYKVLPTGVFGLGVAYNGSQIKEAPWNFSYDFVEIFLYSRYYITDKRRRVFIDTKLGCAMALMISDNAPYSSGPMLQPGVGIEFASASRGRFAIHLKRNLQVTNIESGISNSERYDLERHVLSRTTFGVSYNF